MLKLTALNFNKIWGYEQWIASTHKNGLQKDFYQQLGGDYPLLVKIIQANQTLSIQVHPNNKLAVELEGQGFCGKTECWYVLDAKEDAKVIYGLKDDYDKNILKNAIDQNNLENYLNSVSVKKGDFIFIPAGTVHAICGGLRLLEIQQSSDITYRLYDWGRPREIHVEKGLYAINNSLLVPIKQLKDKFECEYFSIKILKSTQENSITITVPNKLKITPKDWQLFYILNSENATLVFNDKNIALSNEDIFAICPNETIKIIGVADIIQIIPT